MSGIVLYDFWRSSAAYRVRIALNLKGLAYRAVPINLTKGEQASAEYSALNPQGLVPALLIDGHLLTQSLAIIDYLDRTAAGTMLLPDEPVARARTYAQALVIAADVHPIQNLRVLNYLRRELGLEEPAVAAWAREWIGSGFAALEVQAPEQGLFGGEVPNLADLCLVPQMANARRFELPLDPYPRLARIDAALRALPAFAAAAPEAVRPA